MRQPVIILGGGGHARVLIDILQTHDVEIIGITLAEPTFDELFGYPVLGNDNAVYRWKPSDVLLVNAIGSIGIPTNRKLLYEKFHAKGYRFASVIHPSAIIASDCKLGEGVQIMAGAVLQSGSCIGNNVIINTKASIDHDTVVGQHVHIAVGSTIAGGVRIGDCAFIGAGSTIIQNIDIGANSIVAAGAVVIRDIKESTTVMGVPAREVNR